MIKDKSAISDPERRYAFRQAVWVVNDPSSATRRTGRTDCNRNAPAGFAAALWLNEAATRRKEGIGLPSWAGCCIRYRMLRRNFFPDFRWRRKPKTNTIRIFFEGVK